MTPASDLILEASKFRDRAVPAATKNANEAVRATIQSLPKWYHPDVGAARYRAMVREGSTGLPAPVMLDCAVSFTIPSREKGRSIPCRVIKPETMPTGVFMLIPGGGWVLDDEMSQDEYLKSYVDSTNMVGIAVGYRLAPEYPFPAAPEDCYDAVEWLVDNSEKEFSVPLKFITGESAGGHLTVLTALHLVTHSNPTYANFPLKGLVLHCGLYDLSKTPSSFTVDDPGLPAEMLEHFMNSFVPDPKVSRQDPSVSPLYFNFSTLPTSTRIPPAIFVCGTADCLLDDTIFMSAKWLMAGGEAVVKIVPGGPHGLSSLPQDMYPEVKDVMEGVAAFIKERS